MGIQACSPSVKQDIDTLEKYRAELPKLIWLNLIAIKKEGWQVISLTTIKGMDDLQLDYLSQVYNEEKNRLWTLL